jgi:putative tricarboxylic transport membrane protein
LLGFFLEKAKVPLGPFIIGVILSPIAEVNLRASMMRANGSLIPFFTRPISLVFIIIAALSLGITLYKEFSNKKSKMQQTSESVLGKK